MMVTSVMSFAAVGPGELDPAVFNPVDGPYVKAIRPDHVNMLLEADFQFLHPRLRSSEFIALLGQEVELRLLIGDTLRRELLDRGAGIGRRLLGQFGEVFPYGGDAFVDLCDAQRNLVHGSSPRHRSCAIGSPQGRAGFACTLQAPRLQRLDEIAAPTRQFCVWACRQGKLTDRYRF